MSVRPTEGVGPLLKFFHERTSSYHGMLRRAGSSYTRYALVNRELGQGLLGAVESDPRAIRHGMIIDGGPVTSGGVSSLDIPWAFSESSRARAVDGTWTDGAQLMIIRTKSVGSYPIEVERQDVRLELEADWLR